MEDYLALPPGLVYETHSEQSQSPSSSHDAALSAETDWLHWDSREEENIFANESLFPTDDVNIFTANELHDHSIDSPMHTSTAPKTGPPEFSVTPEMLRDLLDTSDLIQDPQTVAPTLTSSTSKRKLSDPSPDHMPTPYSASSKTEDMSNREGSLSDDSPVLKKRASGPRPPKVSHNVIEKRYRSNLNDKIMDLRDVVPILKAEADAGNLKHAKGKIISGATDYIRELEAKNAKLIQENNRLTAKLHGETKPKSGGTLSKVVVGGLAGMMCMSGLQDDPQVQQHVKRDLDDPHALAWSGPKIMMAMVKMLLLICAILYIFNPDIFAAPKDRPKEHQEKYCQSSCDDCSQEDVQENREAVHNNVSAMLEMPCDRPGFFKRIIQGSFILALKILIGQSGWNVLFNRGLDYALTRQRACRMLIEAQLLGGDKTINQAKLVISAMQSLGYRMPKEMRAIHFAMVCHGYVPASILQWCVSLFWTASVEDDDVLQLPLDELLSQRVLDAIWAWTTGVEDPLIANVRSDETINTPLRQLSSIHASLLQNQILREWLRGSGTTSELNKKMQKLIQYSPSDSRIMTNSLYLQSMIEPNDWLEKAMLKSVSVKSGRASPMASSEEVSAQLRCCVLLNLLEKNPKSEEVNDILQMAEVETSSLLPGYSSRIVANCIAKHNLDEDEGISKALRRICAKIGGHEQMRC